VGRVRIPTLERHTRIDVFYRCGFVSVFAINSENDIIIRNLTRGMPEVKFTEELGMGHTGNNFRDAISRRSGTDFERV
jgi:hypothetical protein